MISKPKSQKYKSVGEWYDNKFFRSQAELARYKVLKERQRKGIISGLKCQPRFKIIHNDVRITTYVADFEYFRDGEVVVEDVKGKIMPSYKINLKLMRAFYPDIHITEVKARMRVAGIAWFVDGEPEGVVE